VRTSGLLITGAAFVLGFMMPTRVGATEVSGGVSLGGFLAGRVPRLAVSPHVGASWRMKRELIFAVQDQCSVLPPSHEIGVGVYNQTSIAVGYASQNANFSAGPSFSIYSVPACSSSFLCGRVVGVAPGGHAQVDVYLTGPLGVSVSGNVDWVGGNSLVLPGGVAVTVVAGPVFRWRDR
jgi:hypothetical protein